MYNSYQPASQAATFHYSKGFGGMDRAQHWYGQDAALGTSTVAADLESMMWHPASSMTGGGGGGLQVPGLGSGATSAACPSPLVALEASGGSPILSSPPSSNASSSSATSYPAGYGLMVPPTVPSHSMGSQAANEDVGTNAPTSLFELHHASSIKPDAAAESRGCSGMSGSHAQYGDPNAQLSAWSESSHASAYVSSSPTPPPPAPHAPPPFPFESWQQPNVTN